MSKVLETLEKVVATVSSALSGPVIPAVIAIGKEVLELVDNVREVANTDDVDKLNLMYNELEPLVMAHADSTEAALRGEE